MGFFDSKEEKEKKEEIKQTKEKINKHGVSNWLTKGNY